MKVKAPVEGFTGTVAGVEFADGVGETTDRNALNYFRRHRYTVGSEKPAPEPTPEPAPGPREPSEAPVEQPKPAKKAAAKKAPAKKAAAKPSEK